MRTRMHDKAQIDLAISGQFPGVEAQGVCGGAVVLPPLSTPGHPHRPTAAVGEQGSSDGVATLAARIHAGDRQAESELFRRFYDPVRFMLRHRTGNIALADDLCQETFIIVLLKLRSGGLREAEKLAGYIHRTAHFVYVGWVRKEARHMTDANSDFIANLGSERDGPYEEALRAQVAHSVRGLLDELSVPRDHEILYHYYVLGSEKAEICAVLGLTATHFDRVIHRARSRLRALAGRLGIDPNDLLAHGESA